MNNLVPLSLKDKKGSGAPPMKRKSLMKKQRTGDKI